MTNDLKRADLDSLGQWVKAHASGAELVIPFAQAKALLDELRQMQQGAVLLRKQNKKLRLRIALLKEGSATDEAAGDGEDV
jgi:hypothetical protein